MNSQMKNTGVPNNCQAHAWYSTGNTLGSPLCLFHIPSNALGYLVSKAHSKLDDESS